MSVDPIRQAVQAVLDAHDDGWILSTYVVAMGLEQVDDDGIRTSKWWYAPTSQHEDFTDALARYLIDVMGSRYDNDE